MSAIVCADCNEQSSEARSCLQCGRPADGRGEDPPSPGLAWASRLVLLLALAFGVYGMEYGGGVLFSLATTGICAAFITSFWRPRVGVVTAGTLLLLLVFLQLLS